MNNAGMRAGLIHRRTHRLF